MLHEIISFVTEPLYLKDSYLKEFIAKVIAVHNNSIELDKTVFYPTGGGQPNDTGVISLNGNDLEVVDVKKHGDKILHYVNSQPNLQTDSKIIGKIVWNRRYKFMRMHTAAHIIASIFNTKHGALITGNQIGLEKTRFDFSLEGFDRQKIEGCIEEANFQISKNAEVKVYFLKREEAMKIPNIVKLAGALPPNLEILRIVEIMGIDTQADGGTHVKNTQEIGKIELVKMENRGKTNRRVYFKLNPS